MKADKIEIRKHLKKKLAPERYEHTLGVCYISIALAMKYGVDLEKAELAGLLHDCAKRYTNDVIISKCSKHGVELTEEEIAAPAVIHAKLGAWMAEHKYGITDPDVISAIACHTTGKPNMSLLDKILFVADYIEPDRDKAPNLSLYRRLAFENIDLCLTAIMSSTLDYLLKEGKPVDPMTYRAYEYYKDLEKKEETWNGRLKRND